MNALTARAAVLRNSAATLDNLDGVEQKDLTDQLVEISPLPNWIDRYLIRIVIEALPAALAWLADRTQRDAENEGKASLDTGGMMLPGSPSAGDGTSPQVPPGFTGRHA